MQPSPVHLQKGNWIAALYFFRHYIYLVRTYNMCGESCGYVHQAGGAIRHHQPGHPLMAFLFAVWTGER